MRLIYCYIYYRNNDCVIETFKMCIHTERQFLFIFYITIDISFKILIDIVLHNYTHSHYFYNYKLSDFVELSRFGGISLLKIF